MADATIPNYSEVEPASGIPELVREHFTSVYRLALASLDDLPAARKTAVLAFAEFWLEKTGHPGVVSDRRLYELEVKHLHKKGTGQPSAIAPSTKIEPVSSELPDPAIERFNQAVDQLGVSERHLLVLVYVLGWQPGQASAVLGVGQGAALSQLALFHNRLSPLLEDIPESIIPPLEKLPGLPIELGGPADERAAAILQARWTAPVVNEEEIELLTRQIEAQAESLRLQRQKSAPYRRLTITLIMAAVLLLCLTGGLGAWLIYAQSTAAGPQGTPTATAYGASAGFPQVTKMAPLTRRSSDDDIRQRWVESPSLWHSLSADLPDLALWPAELLRPAARLP